MVGSDIEVGQNAGFSAAPLRVGPVSLPNRVILAPMSGITDAPFRRLAERLGAGLVVSEMTACAGLAKGEREARVRSDGAGVATHVVQLAGCEARYMAEGARIAESQGAAHRRHQYGLPLQTGDQRSCRLRPDARSRSCVAADRGDGCRGQRAGHAENAARLGSRQPQCAGACPPRRSRRCADDHRARPHPLSVLCRQGRLVGRPTRQGSRRHSRRRQWRHCWLR